MKRPQHEGFRAICWPRRTLLRSLGLGSRHGPRPGSPDPSHLVPPGQRGWVPCVFLWTPSLFFFSLRCIYFWLCWVWVATHRLSPLVVSMGYFLLVMCGLLIAVVSLVAECRLWGLQQLRLMSSRARAEYLWRNGFSCSTARGISPDQGLNPCPVLAGGFFTPEPPGKPWNSQSGPLL